MKILKYASFGLSIIVKVFKYLGIGFLIGIGYVLAISTIFLFLFLNNKVYKLFRDLYKLLNENKDKISIYFDKKLNK